MRGLILTLLLPIFAACAALAGKPAPDNEKAFEDAEVDKVAVRIPGLGPVNAEYPPKLQNERIQGMAVVEFVIDTLGVPQMRTFKIVKTDHELFAEAAKTAVRHARFTPAEKNGHKVRMLARQPFVFTLVP
jgi:periplasmic protein TonB